MCGIFRQQSHNIHRKPFQNILKKIKENKCQKSKYNKSCVCSSHNPVAPPLTPSSEPCFYLLNRFLHLTCISRLRRWTRCHRGPWQGWQIDQGTRTHTSPLSPALSFPYLLLTTPHNLPHTEIDLYTCSTALPSIIKRRIKRNIPHIQSDLCILLQEQCFIEIVCVTASYLDPLLNQKTRGL